MDGMMRKELELPEVDYQAAYEAWIAERRKEELKLTEAAEGSHIVD